MIGSMDIYDNFFNVTQYRRNTDFQRGKCLRSYSLTVYVSMTAGN